MGMSGKKAKKRLDARIADYDKKLKGDPAFTKPGSMKK